LQFPIGNFAPRPILRIWRITAPINRRKSVNLHQARVAGVCLPQLNQAGLCFDGVVEYLNYSSHDWQLFGFGSALKQHVEMAVAFQQQFLLEITDRFALEILHPIFGLGQ